MITEQTLQDSKDSLESILSLLGEHDAIVFGGIIANQAVMAKVELLREVQARYGDRIPAQFFTTKIDSYLQEMGKNIKTIESVM